MSWSRKVNLSFIANGELLAAKQINFLKIGGDQRLTHQLFLRTRAVKVSTPLASISLAKLMLCLSSTLRTIGLLISLTDQGAKPNG